MLSLSYSFCMSMLHSLWQAGLLLAVYFLIDVCFLKKNTALARRNFLFSGIAAQLVFFITTFSIYFFGSTDAVAENSLNEIISPLLSSDITYQVAPWIFSLYIFAITYKMCKAIYGWYSFKNKYKSGLEKPGIDIKLFTKVKAHHLGIKRKVTLWLSNTISTPVTFGFFKPVILLPVTLVNQISTQQAETLILHELSHIKVNDYLLNWFLLAAENIFFFNPFVLAFCKKIKLEREKYCDNNVIAFNYPAMLYAETLLQAERIKQLMPSFQLAAVNSKKQLLHRIQFFTANKNTGYKRQSNLFAGVLSGAIVAAFISVLFFHLPLASKKAAEKAIVSDISYTNENELLTKFINNTIPAEVMDNVNKVVAEVQKHQPEIDDQVKKMQPYIKRIQAQAQQIADDASNVNVVLTPVSLKENDATREIVVKEEASGSKAASVKVYELRFQNGQWVIQPKWMATAKEIADSLISKIDTSAVMALPQQQ